MEAIKTDWHRAICNILSLMCSPLSGSSFGLRGTCGLEGIGVRMKSEPEAECVNRVLSHRVIFGCVCVCFVIQIPGHRSFLRDFVGVEIEK